jgi:hypothetical protein
MFRLGIILVELGMGQLVRDIKKGDGSNQHEEMLLLCKPDTDSVEDGEFHTLSDIMKILVRNMAMTMPLLHIIALARFEICVVRLHRRVQEPPLMTL